MTNIYKKIKINWTYPIQPTSLQVGTVKIYRGTSEFTIDNSLSQTELVTKDYDPSFTEFIDDFELQEDTTYYYMIIVYGDIHPEIFAATELYVGYIPLAEIDPKTVKPMIVSFHNGNLPYFYSHSPLKIDWGTLEEESYSWYADNEEGFITAEPTRILPAIGNEKPLYIYENRLQHIDGYIGNKIRITHLDGKSPIDWIFVPSAQIEQWYSGGYSSFKRQDSNYIGKGIDGLGLSFYRLPDEAPPRTYDLSYMFAHAVPTVSVEKWDVSHIRKMDYMFSDVEMPFELDLSQWNTPKIKNRPIEFCKDASNILEPVWGTNTNPTHVLDKRSMILGPFVYNSNDDFNNTIFSKTELKITVPDLFKVEESDFSDSLPGYFVYKISIEGESNFDYLRTGDIKVEPLSGAGQIIEFGCGQSFLGIKQWWVDGYKGFSPFGTNVCYLPEILPNNTDDISYLCSFQNINSQQVGKWDVSGIKKMVGLFKHKYYIVGDLSKWDVSNVEDMSYMFENCILSGKSIGSWNVKNVRKMDGMFKNASGLFDYRAMLHSNRSGTSTKDYAYDLTNWCVAYIHSKPTLFDENIDDDVDKSKFPIWGTCPLGQVTPEDIGQEIEKGPERLPGEEDALVISSAMGYLYLYSSKEVEVFVTEGDASISYENTEGLHMYLGTPTSYNSVTRYAVKPLVAGEKLPGLSATYTTEVIHWCPSGHESFGLMGMGFSSQLVRVPSKAPPNTTNLSNLFMGARDFNQDISSWEVSKVEKMSMMFAEASSFDQDLSGWCVSKIHKKPGGFAIESELESKPEKHPVWGTCPSGILPPYDPSLEPPIEYGAGLILSHPTDNAIELAVIGDAIVDFGSNVVESMEQGPMEISPGVSYTAYSGTYSHDTDPSEILITILPKVSGDKLPVIMNGNLTKVVQWCPSGHVGFSHEIIGGPIGLGEELLEVPNTPPPNTPDISGLFANCLKFNQDISDWDVSDVTNMDYIFYNSPSFLQNLSGWCVSNIIEEPVEFVKDGYPSLFKPVWGTCPAGGVKNSFLIGDWDLSTDIRLEGVDVVYKASKQGVTSSASVPLSTILYRLLNAYDYSDEIFSIICDVVQELLQTPYDDKTVEVDKVTKTITSVAEPANSCSFDQFVLEYLRILNDPDEYWPQENLKACHSQLITTIFSEERSSETIPKVVFSADLLSQFNNN